MAEGQDDPPAVPEPGAGSSGFRPAPGGGRSALGTSRVSKLIPSELVDTFPTFPPCYLYWSPPVGMSEWVSGISLMLLSVST